MGYDVSSEVMISIDFQGQSAQMVMSSQTALLFKSLESLWVEIGIEVFELSECFTWDITVQRIFLSTYSYVTWNYTHKELLFISF